MLNLLRKHIIHPLKAAERQRLIGAAARQAAALNRAEFPGRILLPEPYAIGLSERAIELMLVQLLYAPGQEILDVGHANAQPAYRRMLATLPGPRRLTGLDIAAPVYDTRPFYTRSVQADVCNSPFERNTFDQVWCISTLEHFGMDISMYTSAYQRDAGLPGRALRSMVDLLKPGGKLLLTVPFGRFEDHQWLINYDLPHWQRLVDTVRPDVTVREWFFRHTNDRGWHAVPAEELAFTGYRDQRNFGAAGVVAAMLEKK